MPVALVVEPPGKDSGPKDSQQAVNHDFIAINLDARPRDINWLCETRNHQAGSSQLGSAFQDRLIGQSK
jgi:hypothetical protein